ncbi:MAG: phospholipase D-like domain-containing protein [Dongiaceae bacterium]
MAYLETLAWLRPEFLAALHVLAAALVTGHVLLHKRDVRAAIAWIGLSWLSPFAGSLLYTMFGINRVRRRAVRAGWRPALSRWDAAPLPAVQSEEFAPLERAVGSITKRPPLAGNAIRSLRNGDEAYPLMLEAISQATKSVALSSYIFFADDAGDKFIDALVAAKSRGVEVRVIIDGVGSGYFWSTTYSRLRRHQVPVARFMHSHLPWQMPFLNLRNHKKILLIDGRKGFVGGLNISASNLLDSHPPQPVRDMHFYVEGPVLGQITEAFASDWLFAMGEELRGEIWFPDLAEAGPALTRIITSGPDQDIDKIQFVFLQAIGSAERSIKIITPYFLPDDRLIAALSLAAMRGVDVDVVVPEASDHLVMDWALRANIGPLLQAGCRIWRAPRPFEHSKMLTVDGGWSLIGSANWDLRSLRLNFEITMEVYDRAFATLVFQQIEAKQGKPITLKELNARSLPVRLRDSAVRLMLPYL